MSRLLRFVHRPLPPRARPWSLQTPTRLPPPPSRRTLFSVRRPERPGPPPSARIPLGVLVGGGVIWLLYPKEAFDELSEIPGRRLRRAQKNDGGDDEKGAGAEPGQSGAWFNFSSSFESLSALTDLQWSTLSDSIVDFILPDWSKMIPGHLRKLQRELSMAPGSLADEIWTEAHDPHVNPEIRYSAAVRVSTDLCPEEREFLARRKKITTVALAKYLDIPERGVHPDDVPVIAMCGSGGGLRALVAASGSLMATQDDGLLDCLTYTAGVSGSCWLQALYLSSVSNQDIRRLVDHLKARLGVHIAYPPVAFQSLLHAPTNKHLLSGLVEKLRGDPDADFGLVDIYGILLAARLLVPKGELGVNGLDFKLSNQQAYIKYGAHPMPIYTAVRHEIPDSDPATDRTVPSASEASKAEAKREAWFQWFEITPYEMFCEEFAAGIPTWAVGRKFRGGSDQPPEHGFHLPEIRMPLLFGIFGSAFCATLSHYYREVRPVVRSISGLGTIDEMISGRNEDLSKVHPIDPARIPNFVYGMEGRLARTAPESICKTPYLHLMDAGMSNNLPVYPLLRPGRDVDVLIAFDASADMRSDNWLSVVEGYAKQRGIKGWPVGIGWPRAAASPEQVGRELEDSAARSPSEAETKLERARRAAPAPVANPLGPPHAHSGSRSHPEDLGYCTVWVGSTAERETADPPPPPPPLEAVDDRSHWRLLEPTAGMAVVYLPLLPNPRVPGVNPGESDYLSTWNFVYEPQNVDDVVALARANYAEGRDQIRACVRAVYERKKRAREEAARLSKEERFRRRVRKGLTHRFGEGDQFG